MHATKRVQQPPEFLVVGRVLRPHGVRGALVVEPLSSMIRSIEGRSEIHLGDPPRVYKLEAIRPHRKRYLIVLEGCSSREDADQFRGMELRIPFDEAEPLPPGEYYYWQILGLRVHTKEGENLGEVSQILETGANDVYIVRTDDGKELLIPAIGPVIRTIDLERGLIEIEVIPGLFDH